MVVLVWPSAVVLTLLQMLPEGVLVVASTPMTSQSEGQLLVALVVVASTLTPPQSEGEMVVMLVVASTPPPQLEGELMVVLVRPSAVMSMLLSAALLLSLKLF